LPDFHFDVSAVKKGKNTVMRRLERFHVAPGTYQVSKSKALILRASLGTCVGLALFDQENRVGGLLHLLLDKPPLHGSSLQAGKYATTGLPLFWEALLAAGASPKNLKAWIAGGALVGPLAKYDLELDIGGRTTDRVVDFLTKKSIDVVQSETGGFFTCVLQLNIQTGECTIEPSGFERFTAKECSHISTAEEIERSIENLQPIPQVALKILRLINEDDYDIALLTSEIRKDQTLSAQTIKLCNSVFLGSKNKIASLDHALAYLGQKILVQFVISAAIATFFSQAGMGYSLCKGGLYHHAAGTALIAEKIAEETGKAPPALAYTAGLLHDIGKVVLDQYIQTALPLFYRQLNQEGKNSTDAERAIFGIDHREAGTTLALRWWFPESLTETIRCHHSPETAVQSKDLVHIIYLADLLMSRFHVGLEVERLDTDDLANRLETLGLSRNSFPDIVAMIPLQALASVPQMTMLNE
jgi:putative nucleotidyltransferase with HDIG domain